MKRNKHSLSNTNLSTFEMGQLVPINVTEVLPGDSIQQATSALLRMAPLLRPAMHPVHVEIKHFFVPHRLVWDDWEDFITGGEDGADASTFPTLSIAGGVVQGTLANFLGLPLGYTGAVNALPFRAYNLIYNEHFRDQDLQTAMTIDKTDGS